MALTLLIFPMTGLRRFEFAGEKALDGLRRVSELRADGVDEVDLIADEERVVSEIRDQVGTLTAIRREHPFSADRTDPMRELIRDERTLLRHMAGMAPEDVGAELEALHARYAEICCL